MAGSCWRAMSASVVTPVSDGDSIWSPTLRPGFPPWKYCLAAALTPSEPQSRACQCHGAQALCPGCAGQVVVYGEAPALCPRPGKLAEITLAFVPAGIAPERSRTGDGRDGHLGDDRGAALQAAARVHQQDRVRRGLPFGLHLVQRAQAGHVRVEGPHHGVADGDLEDTDVHLVWPAIAAAGKAV